MEQYTDSQYDDDLTVGIDELEESIETEYVDLFEHGGSEESPVARLKTIVLSIDWEITDDNLTQFNEELLDLKDIWADDKLKLVYVQALQKISKYIFQLKSESHPDAIKLLLTFFYNLEKIVVDSNLSEADKKEILRGDVKKFEQLKYQISGHVRSDQDPAKKKPAAIPTATITEHGESHPVLFNLKASILGMDWEINERELNELSREIKQLEERFADNKTKLIFLQGIERLGGYIKLKRSNAHADAFKLLYSFYEGLEKTVLNDLSKEEEKALLLPEVEKFEKFKQIIAPTITPEALSIQSQEDLQDADFADDDDFVRPAFSDVPSDVTGFQAEKEAIKIQDTAPVDVEDRLENFFSEDAGTEVSAQEGLSAEAEEQLASFFDEAEMAKAQTSISAEEALRGVDVESDADDESEEEALPIQDDGVVAPALVETEEEFGFSPASEAPGLIAEADDKPPSEVEERLGSLFEAEDETIAQSDVDPAVALAGVDVETDADDDAGETPLPADEDDLAPALAKTDEPEEKGEELDEIAAVPEAFDIEGHVEGFFPEDTEGVALTADISDSEAIAGSLPDEETISEAELEGALFAAEEEIAEQLEKPELAGFQTDSDATEEQVETLFGGESEEFFEEQIFKAVDQPDAETPELEVVAGESDDTIEERVDSFFGDEEEEFLASEFEAETPVEQAESKDEEPEDRVELETAELVSELEEYQEEIAEEQEAEPEAADLAPELEVEEEAVEEEAEAEAVVLAPELEFEGEAVEEEAEPEAAELAPELEAEDEVIFEAVSEDEREQTTAEDLPTAEIEESLLEEEDFFTATAEDFGEPTKATILPVDKSDFFVDETAVIEDIPEEDSFIDKEFAETEEEEKAFFASTDYEEGDEHAFFASTDDIEEAVEEVAETAEDAEEEEEAFFEEPEEAADVEHEYEEELNDVGVAAIPSVDHLAPLRAGIESLSAEITDANVQGVFAALNGVRRQLVSKPMEKTCLQLVSTVVQHLGKYKEEASPEASGLLHSVFEKLELMQKPETQPNQAQDALLSETFKVLQWQQRMLDRQTITKDGQLTFVNPLLAEGVDVTEPGPDITKKDEVPAEETKLKVKAVSKSEIGLLADVIRTEVEELRGTFKTEIEKLRQQLKDISNLE